MNVLDFTAESVPEPAQTVRTIPYDPRPQEDTARRSIAYILLGILAVAIFAAIAILAVWPDRLEPLLKLYQFIFTPLVALVSAATGFYYGTKSRSKSK